MTTPKEHKTSKDRHAANCLIRLIPEIHQALRRAAVSNSRAMTQELHDIIVRDLRRRGFWPPKD